MLWNPQIYYRVHNSPRDVHIRSQINHIQAIPSYFCKTFFDIFSHLRLGFTSGLFPSSFYQNPVCTFPLPKSRTCVCQVSQQRMAVSVQGVVLLVVTPCSLVGRHRHVDCYNGLFAYGGIEYTCHLCDVCTESVSVPSQNFCYCYEIAALMQCLTRNLVECE